MAQTTFAVDDDILKALAELKVEFGVKTNAQVIRKAIALARIAVRNADSDRELTIVSPDQQIKKVMLIG